MANVGGRGNEWNRFPQVVEEEKDVLAVPILRDSAVLDVYEFTNHVAVGHHQVRPNQEARSTEFLNDAS